ncbi:PP2C family protein-serine/threonine phosphatase [Butyricimonas virosa]|jgi:protein phosphatase/kinase family protein
MKPCDVYSITCSGKREVIEDVTNFTEISETCFLFILVDGMGGLSRGMQAARLIVLEVMSYITSNIENENVEELLRHAMEQANRGIEEESRKYQCKMGGTISILLCKDDTASVAWLGDVRVYHIHDNILDKITNEHILDSEPYIVTRCLNGKALEQEIPVVHLPIHKKDRFVLCSDGFYNTINEKDILKYKNEKLFSRIGENDDNYSVTDIQF